MALPRKKQVRCGRPVIETRTHQRMGTQAAGLAADPLLQLDEAHAFGAHFQQGAAKERDVGQEFLGQYPQIAADVEIGDAIGEEVVVEHWHSGDLLFLPRHGFDRWIEVAQLQAGQLGQILGRVGLFLQVLELFGSRDEFL